MIMSLVSQPMLLNYYKFHQYAIFKQLFSSSARCLPDEKRTAKRCPSICSVGTNSTFKGTRKNVAAFFDVDGTIARTNVVAAYFVNRVREIPKAAWLFWVPWFALSCILYIIIDRIDRAMFNRLFYSLFKDRSSKDKMRIARTIYENYYRPRIFGDAVELIQLLKNHGFHIVLVTGCLDFLIAPLARNLGADFVYASELVEEDGKFTGEVRGAGARSSMKANFVQRYAKMHRICLSSSLAFGDSIADLCMLETVGFPHAVNPDGKLKDVASTRGWPIISWKLEENPESRPLRLPLSVNNFRSCSRFL